MAKSVFWDKARWALLVSLLAILISIWASYYAVTESIRSKQLIELQLDSFTPFFPEFGFQIYGGENAIHLRQEWLAQPLSYDLDNTTLTWSKEDFDLLVYNTGKLNSGPINIEITHPLFHIPRQYKENLNGTSQITIKFEIWFEGCGQGNPPENCNKSMVPIGIQEFQINLTCSYCKKPLNKKVKACIYKVDREVECGLTKS